VDLVARRPSLPIVVCCSTRDDLDSLCSSLSALPFVSSSALVSLLFSHPQFILFLVIPTRYTIVFPNSLLFPPFPFSACQYSDLAEDERAFLLEKFRQVTAQWNQTNHGGAPNEDEIGKDERSHMIIVTDACLPLLSSGELPLNAHLLINYELPAKKVFLFRFFFLLQISISAADIYLRSSYFPHYFCVSCRRHTLGD